MSKTIVKPVSTKPTLLDEINEVTSKTYNVKEEITKLIEPKVNSLDELAENSLKKQIHPDTSEYECFFHYTDDLIYKAGFEQGHQEACKTHYSEDEVKKLSEDFYHYGRLNCEINIPAFEEKFKNNKK